MLLGYCGPYPHPSPLPGRERGTDSSFAILSLGDLEENRSAMSKSVDHPIALVTGTLAEPALRDAAQELRRTFDLEATVIVLNIQVAALMTVEWLERKLELPAGVGCDRVVLPGYTRGDVTALAEKLGVPVELGPKEVQDLPEHFGAESKARQGYGEYDIEIIAEINHAPLLSMEELLAQAEALTSDGADVIDVGCEPGVDRDAWNGLPDAVRALKDRGCRVSVDSMHVGEIEAACAAGAELVLSVNAMNREAASGGGAEVVAIPDDPRDLSGLNATIDHLVKHDVAFRIDPIVEPIGFGFAASLERYIDVRRRYPGAEMMMGVGNLSEMTQVDSAGVNMMLIGFCQELGIRSVLTTQVINYARSSVAEIDVARRLCHHAVRQQMPPKHLDDRLVMLRDEKLRTQGDAALEQLASKLTDRNYRIYAENGRIHCMNKDVHVTGDDPSALFDQLAAVDPAHAFYLGFEMAKAVTAITLGKNYVQDQALNWGMLTREEESHGHS